MFSQMIRHAVAASNLTLEDISLTGVVSRGYWDAKSGRTAMVERTSHYAIRGGCQWFNEHQLYMMWQPYSSACFASYEHLKHKNKILLVCMQIPSFVCEDRQLLMGLEN